jgi:hypothetical protein
MPKQFDPFIVFEKIFDVIRQLYYTYAAGFIEPYLPLIKGILNIISALLLVGIILITIKLREVRKKENEMYSPVEFENTVEGERKTQWEIILGHVNSTNSSEWKLAIIEADSILDNILKEVGYEGDTLSDRLKAAGDGDIIQQAWEAHKIRNQIAHNGDVELTHREAKRVVGLYENVFKKFGYI